MKIIKGDTVLIISGKDKGKKAKVLKSFPKDNKVLVEGVNLAKRHRRPRKQGEKGQIIELPLPFNVSRVKLVCPKCGKAVRVGYKIGEGKKFRMCKECMQEI